MQPPSATPPPALEPPSLTPDDGKLDFSVKGRRQEVRFKWPRDSHQLKDDEGNPLFDCEMDPVTGEPKLNEWGRATLKLDAKGNPIPLMSPQPDPSEQVEIILQYTKPGRRLRQEAINAAIASSMQSRKRRSFDFAAFERYIVNRMLTWTNIKDVPGPGWDNLEDPDLGDYIVEVLGVWKTIGGKEAMELGKASPPEAPSASGVSTSSTT